MIFRTKFSTCVSSWSVMSMLMMALMLMITLLF